MGIDWSKIGNVDVDVFKKAGKSLAGFGKATGEAAATYGKSIMNPKTFLAAGSIGAATYAFADADGRTDSSKVAGTAALATGITSGVAGIGTVGTAVGMVGFTGLSSVAGIAMGVGRKSLKMPKEAVSFENMGDIKFNKLGVGLVLGSGMIDGAKRAVNKYEQIKMGTNDGMLRSQTPVIPQRDTPAYANNAGATGDLVFSMYNNR